MKEGGRVSHPIVKFILAEIAATYRPLSEIGEKSGIHWHTIHNWKAGRSSPNLVTAEAVLNTLGYDLVIVKRGTIPATPGNDHT